MRKPTRVKTLHFKVGNISRNKARPDNAVAACAYQSRQDLQDEKSQKVHPYERLGGLVERAVIAPDNAPDWMRDTDQQRLWERFGNEIEKVEDGHNRRASALLAKSFVIAAPRELSDEQNWKLGTAFAEALKARGLAAGIAMHQEDAADGGKNPHFHVIVSMRPVEENGFSKKKWRGLDAPGRGENPELRKLRHEYYGLVNDVLKQAGIEGVHYDPEKQQDKQPGEHIGKLGHATEGTAKDKAEKLLQRNREVALQNHVQAKVSRAASPEWREMKREDRRRDLQMGRGASMAARDVSQRAMPTARGTKTAATAVDRALHSESWREKEQAREQRPGRGKVDAAVDDARRSSGWREREEAREKERTPEQRRKEKLPDL